MLLQISVVFYPVASVVHLVTKKIQYFKIKMTSALHAICRGKGFFLLFSFCHFFFLPAPNRDAFKLLVFMLQANANKRVTKLAEF